MMAFFALITLFLSSFSLLCSGTPVIYTSQSAFVAALLPNSVLFDYSDETPYVSNVISSYSATVSGVTQTITPVTSQPPKLFVCSVDSLYTVIQGFYEANEESLDLAFSGTPVNAVGGLIFATDFNCDSQAATITVSVNGVSQPSFSSSASSLTFWGIINDSPITDFEVQGNTGLLTVTQIYAGNPAPPTPGVVSKDPHFTGFQGEHFDVVGAPDKWFNILSDSNIQLNAYFERACKTNEFTFMSQIAVKVSGHTIYLNQTSAVVDGVILPFYNNWVPVDLGPKGVYGHLLHQWRNYFHLETPAFRIAFERHIVDPTIQKHGMDFFGTNCLTAYFNLNVKLVDFTARPHGILGQTAGHHHQPHIQVKGNEGQGEIEGSYKDYEVSTMYGDDFKFNRYSFNSTS